jgi:hypothetical protein
MADGIGAGDYMLNVTLGGGRFNSRVDGDREALIEQFRHEREHGHHPAESGGALYPRPMHRSARKVLSASNLIYVKPLNKEG